MTELLGHRAFNPRRSLSWQAVALATSSALAQGIMALLLIWSARTSTSADFGTTIAWVSTATAVVPIIDFGSNSYWVREFAAARMTASDLRALSAAKASLTALLSGAFLVTGVIALGFGNTASLAGFMILSLTMSQIAQVPIKGSGRGESVALALIADRLTSALIMAVLVCLGTSPLNALTPALALGPLSGFVTAYHLCPVEARLRLGRGPVRNPWRGALHYGITSAAGGLQSLDLPMLVAVAGPAAGGIYGAVNRWTQPMGLLATAYASASVPYVATAASMDAAKSFALRASWMPFAGMLASLGVAVCSPWLTAVLLGPQYATSASVLTTLALGTVIAIANQPLSSFLQALGGERAVSRLTVLATILQLGLIGFLGHQLGPFGAALAFFALQVIILAILTFEFARNWKRGLR